MEELTKEQIDLAFKTAVEAEYPRNACVFISDYLDLQLGKPYDIEYDPDRKSFIFTSGILNNWQNQMQLTPEGYEGMNVYVNNDGIAEMIQASKPFTKWEEIVNE